MDVMYVSFYTPGYAPGAERLRKSLDKLSLPHDIVAIPDFKGEKPAQWRAAVKHKPVFLREMLEKHEGKAVVWLDADAAVLKTPELFPRLKEDMAAFFYHWRGKNEDELLSGTFYLRNTDQVKVAVDTWIAAMKKSPASDKKPEQQMLQKILPKLGITVFHLPASYCVMSRRTDWSPQNMPVIQHFQWSREGRGGKPLPGVTNVVVKKKATRPPPSHSQRPKPPRPIRKTRDERKRDGERRVAKTGRLIANRRRHIKARRKREGTDLHEEQVPYSYHRLDEVQYRKHVKRRRRARQEADAMDMYKPTHGTAGGVRGVRVSGRELQRARSAMARMRTADELDGELAGQTVIVMGNSATLRQVDLSLIGKLKVVGCNRSLRDKSLWPEYLVIADREPYCQERNSGRLEDAANAGVKILLPDSIFDPDVKLRGPFRNPDRRAQPTPEFPAYLYRFGPKEKPSDYYDQVIAGKIKLPFAFDTFKHELVTCQNVSGSMLQSAVILGAKRVAFIGIELMWPKKGPSHAFGDGKAVGAYEPRGAFQKIMSSMKQARGRLRKMGVEVMNLSPVTDCPWATVWGNYSYDQFVEEYCG